MSNENEDKCESNLFWFGVIGGMFAILLAHLFTEPIVHWFYILRGD